MAKPKVFVTRRVPNEGLDLLREQCEVDIWDSDDVIPRAELVKRVAGVSGIFCTLNDTIDLEILDAAGPSLKVIGTYSAGTEHVDMKECKKREIYVAKTQDVASDSAAELTVALILIVSRRLVEGLDAVRSGEVGHWKPMWLLGNVSMEKTLGLFGFGRVGFGIARRMKPFGVEKIIYTDLFDASYAEGLAKKVSFDELLKESDILCVCCAVTEQTKGLFNSETFSKMKNSAIFINTSRGQIVNHDDLVNALQSKTIAAAGLDVTDPEPLPVDNPLMSMKNCVILPHMGTNTWEARVDMSRNTALNILAVLENN